MSASPERTVWARLLIGLLVFAFWILTTGVVKAGLFSFFEKFWDGASESWSFYNSQNVPLLNAPTATDPKSATGGAVINTVGDSSLLPVTGPLGTIADIETYKSDQITTYTVREGDTLSRVADMFGVSVATIYWANDLKRGDLVKVGDVLVILPISGAQYTVKKGDTVSAIAKKFKGDVAEIIAYNSLEVAPDGVLEEGAILIIPNAELTQPPASGSPSRFRGGSGSAISGYFSRPIVGGRRSQGIHGFNGIDLADRCGTPVFASAGGTVLIVRSQGWNGGYGRYVVIVHPNGTQTVYAHLSLVNVGMGQYVLQGYQVGGIGSSGNSTGCHLHFEVRGARNPF